MTLDDLSQKVNAWCETHAIAPANGQAAEALTERTIRYYRTLSLIDAPNTEGDPYGEKHLLQLVAIKLSQAQGLPLRRIRELLFGRTLEQLREIERRGAREAKDQRDAAGLFPASDELWRMTPLDGDFLLVSRTGRDLRPEQRRAILKVLQS